MSSHHQASSSNTVTTTQAGSHKRPRDVGESSTSTDDAPEKNVPQKRIRVQGDTFQVRLLGKNLNLKLSLNEIFYF